VNPLSRLNAKILVELIRSIDVLRERVLINPYPTPLNENKNWSDVTDVLHRAHISNFMFAENIDKIDTICLDASNSLLFKSGLRNYISGRDGVDHCLLREDWSWYPYVIQDLIYKRNASSVRFGVHEGTFYRGAIFKKMCEYISRYELQLNRGADPFDAKCSFCREEILFPTAHAIENPDDPPVKPYVWMPWEKNLFWTEQEVDLLLKNPQSAPHHYFGLKRVGRNINDAIRISIGNWFGYRHHLTEAIQRNGWVHLR
jgi:hypothetical protein